MRLLQRFRRFYFGIARGYAVSATLKRAPFRLPLTRELSAQLTEGEKKLCVKSLSFPHSFATQNPAPSSEGAEKVLSFTVGSNPRQREPKGKEK